MEAIIERAPWNIDNHLLILIPSSPQQLPYMSDFDWIECCIHFWDLPEFMISEVIGQMFLMRPRVTAIQNKTMIYAGHRFYRIRVKLNVL